MRHFLTAAISFALSACSDTTANAPGAPQTNSSVFLTADWLAFNSNRGGNYEIYTAKTDGSQVKALTNDSTYDNWWPKISPDRQRILFYRAPKGRAENYEQASLWIMNADGTSLTQLRAIGTDGWTVQGHAEWSPDGRKIAMFGTSNGRVQVFVSDALGKNAVQFTNRPGISTDVSWAPDGSQLLFNGCATNICAANNYEIYVMPAEPLAPATALTNNRLADYDPYFSPDGKNIAWLQNIDPNAFATPAGNLGKWAIKIANSDGSNARDLINDGQVNSKPAWSTDGSQIYFHRMVPPDYRFRLFRINKDGSGLTDLSQGSSGSDEYPTN